MDPVLSMSLGAGETTLMQMTTGYAMLVNGGKRIEPTLIDRVQDRHGRTVYRHDLRACEVCEAEAWHNHPAPELPTKSAQAIDPPPAVQIVCLLPGVGHRGTVRRSSGIYISLDGKTGHHDT